MYDSTDGTGKIKPESNNSTSRVDRLVTDPNSTPVYFPFVTPI